MIKPAQRLKDIKEYYFSTKLREISDLNRRGKNIINMGIGNPDLSPPEKVRNALEKATNDNGSHKYQPYKGINQLRMRDTHPKLINALVRLILVRAVIICGFFKCLSLIHI